MFTYGISAITLIQDFPSIAIAAQQATVRMVTCQKQQSDWHYLLNISMFALPIVQKQRTAVPKHGLTELLALFTLKPDQVCLSDLLSIIAESDSYELKKTCILGSPVCLSGRACTRCTTAWGLAAATQGSILTCGPFAAWNPDHPVALQLSLSKGSKSLKNNLAGDRAAMTPGNCELSSPDLVIT